MLLELAKNPAMIVWLDNQDNHKDAINENWGRELLELFSMGVGNYSEEDIKECSRAFTGWTIGNTEYMMVRSARDSDWPYGRIDYFFEYREDDHDNGEKTFLGQTGNFNGEDIVNIICQQDATARFIARHMYHFFVADEPPVPAWPYTPPRDEDAIETLAKAYFDSGYDIIEMLRVLFNSDFFKAEDARYDKVKGPAEFAVGILRMTREFELPNREMINRFRQINWMGQELNNPPSVEGWHQGAEWIDTGTLMERINFASEQLGDLSKPGVRGHGGQYYCGRDRRRWRRRGFILRQAQGERGPSWYALRVDGQPLPGADGRADGVRRHARGAARHRGAGRGPNGRTWRRCFG